MSKNNKVVSIGTSLILVVFIILALVTFAVMSTVSASSDYKSSQNMAQRTKDYYTAANLAEKRIAHIDSLLAEAFKLKEYPASAFKELNSMGELTVDEDEATVSFTVPVNSTQELFVKLSVNPDPKGTDSFYTPIDFREQSTTKWEAEEGLPLIK